MGSKNTNNHKKARERFFLDNIRKHVNWFPEGNIIESEEPDFIIENDATKIGIELVEMLDGNKSKQGFTKKELEEKQNAIINIAKTRYESMSSKLLWVRILFSGIVSDFHSREIGGALANEVIKYTPSQQEDVELSLHYDHLNPLCEIAKIHIETPEWLDVHFWTHASGGWEITEYHDVIQSLLDRKGQKCVNYRKNCDQCWLIIIVEGTGPSSAFKLINKPPSNSFISLFDRSIIYYNMHQHSTILRTITPRP